MTPLASLVVAALGAPLFAQPAAPAPTPVRAAVLVVGEDPYEAGSLQRELERRLGPAVPGLAVRVASDVARRTGAPRPAPTPAVIDPAAALHMEEAIGAYYEAQFLKALDLFAKVQALYESSDAPVSKKTQVLLWRTAVFLGLNDLVQAQTEALAALSLNPELAVDPKSEVPPSVQQQLDAARRSASFKLVTVLVNGLPPTASVTIDGRSVPSRFKVLAGKHRLVVSSNGRRDVVRAFEATSDTAITMSLPISLAPANESAAQSLAWDGTDSPAFAALAEALDAEWIVVASIRGGEARASLRRSSTGTVNRSTTMPAAEAAVKIVQELAPLVIAGMQEQPKGPKTFVVDDGTWLVQTHASVVAAGWLRSISGGEKLETFFGGAGPELRADASKGHFLATGALSYLSYDASSVEVTLPDGSKSSATGGATIRARAGAGWRGLGDDGGRFRVVAGIAAESHSTKDVAAGSAELNLLTGYTRAALDLRGGARLGAPGLPSFLLDLEAGVQPYAYFAEDPDGASGEDPASALAFTWGAALESAPSASRWGLRFAYAGEMRSTKFAGASKAAVNPPMRDAQLDEMFHSFTISVARRF